MKVGLIVVVIAVTSSGCAAPSASEGGFDSANPAAKLYAIEAAAREGDQSAIPNIIEQLDSDDPVVRLMAIGALERLTGETHGYRYDDDVEVRRAAIRRWVDAYGADASRSRAFPGAYADG